MSETEQWSGTLTPIEIPKEHDTWEKQVRYLQTQWCEFAGLDIDDKYFDVENSDCYYYKGAWFSMNKQIYSEDGDIFDANGIPDEKISFRLRYYNGGSSFNEALHRALDGLYE